ncbi:hypothetical protein V1Y59_19475 [Gordonia sp. PKS22-38]|uniref:HD domain-containing protein n=1 Tax=Gordonia prachuapensis TaxID=3115651 RepID=A0ABU7MY58_9ACTN|nr:hypothetical protein [Gordonia sp. PKS22-38]
MSPGSGMSANDVPILEHPLIDDVLARHRDALGPDERTYRNHVYRCANYQRTLLDDDLPDSAVLAWAVHDLGIWTARTFDYLGPSAALGDELAAEFAIGEPELARTMVCDHHGLRARTDPVVETFRLADRVDVSHGLLRSGLDADFVARVVERFPYHGFHAFLVRAGLRHALTHPTRPLPMFRW